MKDSKVFWRITLGLVITLVLFVFNYRPVYGNCQKTIEGNVCKLVKWERR